MLFVWMRMDEIGRILVFDNNSQQRKQVHGLQGSNDSSFQVADIKCYSADARSTQVDSTERSMRKVSFYQITTVEGDGRETAVIETSVPEMAVREAYLIHFAHRQIDVRGITVMQ